jgi:hypothetical protein
MVYYYAFKQMYALDQPALDAGILDLFRAKWAAMVESPLQCSWESFDWGSKAHIYGMYPGYLLSAYVLGVRRDEPVAARAILIEPHLGNLSSAGGVVVTEFGPVPISWRRDGAMLKFAFAVPAGVNATLRLPNDLIGRSVNLDSSSVAIQAGPQRSSLILGAGRHSGSCRLGSSAAAIPFTWAAGQ